ncbi:hypothetical protein GGR51DRAFT_423139 [Nemania sp. FL0031]|nr:hypothetical protein GGR51DRAFT_423139 [Nemania sp. FL0031]
MVPRIDIRSLWELFFSIRPVLKKALPKDVPEDSLPEQEHSSWIRFTFKSIPLAWPDEGQERQKLEHPSLHRPLMNLLTAIENIVLDKIQRGNGYDTLERLGNDKLRSNFPNLALMQQMMLAGSRVNGIQHTRQPKMQRKTLRKLARYVNFTHAQEEIVPKAANLRSAIGNVEKTLAKADDDDIDKARHLTQNEADFVQRAYYWKTKYQELYTALIRSISCSGGHQAQLHLSGFLADETFELLIQDCETEHWNSAKYRWVTVSPNAPGRSYNPIICSKSRDETNKGYQSTSIHQRGGWNDEIQNDGVPNPPQGTKLRDFIVHTPSKMSRQEKGVVQLLLACSLLCLYKSNWVQMGFDTNAISVPVGKTGSDGLARWRPHISCSLETVDRRGNMDDAVLSFGMLLMEMEAGKAAEPTEEDRDWSRERFSQDSTLKRILKEWRGDVQDGYRAVATRCLKFSEKADGHHDPGLKAESQRIGAIYSYILAPLCYVVGQNFKDTPKLFNTIPNTAWDQPFPNNHGASLPWFTSEITLFDGTEVTRPTDE